MIGKILRVANTALAVTAAGLAAGAVIRGVVRESRAGREGAGKRESDSATRGREERANLTLKNLRMENFGPYADAVEVRLAPVTVLIGANGAGKSHMADALETLVQSMSGQWGGMRSPLGRRGREWTELGEVAHRVRGPGEGVALAASWSRGEDTVEVAVRAREGGDARAYVERWRVREGERTFECNERRSTAGPPAHAPAWVHETLEEIGRWSHGTRRLEPQRSEATQVEAEASALGTIACDEGVAERVGTWASEAFGTTLEVHGRGNARHVKVGEGRAARTLRPGTESAAMRGALPVAVACACAARGEPGADIIEHPELGLDGRAQSATARALVAGRGADARMVVIETHSPLTVLAVRRAVARGELAAQEVRALHIEKDGLGRTVRECGLDSEGNPEEWPEGMFTEEYEGVCALRREQRERGDRGRESARGEGAQDGPDKAAEEEAQ